MDDYLILKRQHQKELNDFPLFFAFTEEQFNEGMKKFGLTPGDTDKIYKLGNSGGFMLCTDSPRFNEMYNRHRQEKEEATVADTKGDGYIYQMFLYELANHEYGYTGNVTDTLEALGLTEEKVENSKSLSFGLNKAIKEIRRREEMA